MFRSAETNQLKQIIAAGESASLIGACGVGKSNLFNHLLDHKTQRQMFGAEASNYLVIRINCHFIADLTLRSVYSLLLDQLELLGDYADYYEFDPDIFVKITEHHNKMLDAQGDLLKVQRHFTLAVRQLMRDRRRKLVLLIDQFEELWQEAGRRLFLNLRGLRETYKRRVSFLTFTRDELPILTEVDEARGEFYELLAEHLIGIKPYVSADANYMLINIARRYQLDLTEHQVQHLYEQCGGHAGLLRAAFLATAYDNENVLRETQKIYDSLLFEEQVAIFQLANNSRRFDKSILKRLRQKGLIDADDDVFSPLFCTHLKMLDAPAQSGVRYNAKTDRRIFINGRPTAPLTSLEHRVFYCLYQDADAIVSRDQIALRGWGPEFDVSDDGINQVIKRIRAKIALVGKAIDIIETVHGSGYRFNSPS